MSAVTTGAPAWVERCWPGLTTAPRAGGNLVLLRAVDSTNRLGRRVAQAYLDGALCRPPRVHLLAAEQRTGRGRHGRTWSSPPGLGLYATHLEPLTRGVAYSRLPMVVALALARQLGQWCDDACRIKWPNDLMVHGRKIGGILIDAVWRGRRGAALIGFGVNHRPTGSGPPENATTLWEVSASPPALGELAQGLLRALSRQLDAPWHGDEVVEEYGELSAHRLGESLRVRLPDQILEGAFRGFDTSGRLLLERAGTVRPYAVGEV